MLFLDMFPTGRRHIDHSFSYFDPRCFKCKSEDLYVDPDEYDGLQPDDGLLSCEACGHKETEFEHHLVDIDDLKEELNRLYGLILKLRGVVENPQGIFLNNVPHKPVLEIYEAMISVDIDDDWPPEELTFSDPDYLMDDEDG